MGIAHQVNWFRLLSLSREWNAKDILLRTRSPRRNSKQKKQDNIFQEKETNKEQGNSLRIATLSNDYEAHKFVYIGNVTWIERPTICNSLSFTVFFLHTHTRMLYAYCSGYTIEKDVTTMWPSVGHALSIVTKGYAARAGGQHRDGKHEKSDQYISF